MTEKSALVTAAICTYDRDDLLSLALASLARQSLARDAFRILVVDNAPDADRAAKAGERHQATLPDLVYRHEPTPGLSHARNAAIRACDTPLIAFLDDDAIAEPDWLERILAAFAHFGPTALVVGGRVEPIWPFPRPSWLHDSLLGAITVVDRGDQTRLAGPEEWFAGTNIAFRTEAIRKQGGFSTELGRNGSTRSLLSNEEIELVDRIRAAGGLCVYAADATVQHRVDPERLTRQWFRKRSAWQAVSDFLLPDGGLAGEPKSWWAGAVGYFNLLPPHLRTVRGLLHDTDDPELFRRQTSAIHLLALAMLSGFDGIELD